LAAENGPSRLVNVEAQHVGQLIAVIDASLKVRRRHQLFLWIQGIFQSIVPHETVICLLGESNGRSSEMDHFSITEGREQFFAELCDTDGSLMQRLVKLWIGCGYRPLVIEANQASLNYDPQISPTLTRYKLNNLAAHGTFNAGSEASSFFCFLNLGSPTPSNANYSLELVIPFLSSAYIRTKIESGPVDRPVNYSNKILTTRQAEILLWVQHGKSNAEIGDILKISSLTVKNHVQKILRKLNVQNRAQAVGKGLSLNLMNATRKG
jgi:transcriptional regulator EpsA